jgi:hypothetical protein
MPNLTLVQDTAAATLLNPALQSNIVPCVRLHLDLAYDKSNTGASVQFMIQTKCSCSCLQRRWCLCLHTLKNA